MTVDEIRRQVAEAREQARRNFDRNMGEGAFDALKAYAKENNAKALDDICRALDRHGMS